MAKSNAQRSKEYRARKKKAKLAAAKIVPKELWIFNARGQKTLNLTRDELDEVVPHNLSWLSAVYVRSMTQEEREDRALCMATAGIIYPNEDLTPEECQRMDEERLARKVAREREYAEFRAQQEAKEANYGASWIDDEKLAQILASGGFVEPESHPDHPSHRGWRPHDEDEEDGDVADSEENE